MNRENQQNQNWFLEKFNKTDKRLVRRTKNTMKEISLIRNEKGSITTDSMDIKFEQF